MNDTYDEKCYELAQAFLADRPELDTPQNQHRLAVAVQQAVEDFFLEVR